jgi:FSR family fosmidomycin resistance protein-like MFS transporter
MKPGAKLLTAVGLYHFANDGALAVLPLVLPVIKLKFDLSYTDVGTLTGLGLVVTLAVQLLVSQYAHRFSAVRALTLGMATMFVFAVMMVFVWDFASLLVFVIGMRIGAAVYHPLGLALVAQRYANGKIDMAMGVQSSLGDMGVFLAFVTTGALGAIFDWQSSFALWGAICLTAALVGISLKIGSDPADAPEAGRARNDMTWGDAFSRIGILLIPLTVGGAGYNIIVNYAPLMLQDAYGLEIGIYALVIALWVGTGAVFTLIFGHITSSVGRGKAILASYVLIIASGLIIVLSESLLLAVLAMFLYGVGLFMTYPALFAYVTELTGGRRSERAFGIVFTAQLTGGFLFSFVCGVLSDAYTIKAPFLVLSVIGAVAMVGTGIHLSRKGVGTPGL